MGFVVPNFSRILTRFYQDLLVLKVWVILALVVCYLVISWGLFALAGEDDLTTDLVAFLYFAATTASTVGYGDLSPSTDAGRLIASVFFFPAAVTIFTVMLSKLTVTVVEGVRKMADGRGNYSGKEGATVLVGYHPERTERMIEDLIAGQDNDHTIVLLSRYSDSKVPDGVLFVFAEKLDALQSLRRAAVENAAKVLVYAEGDGETFNCCLAVRELNADVHIAAYFNDRETAARAKRYADVETVVSISTESLVRAAQDPGASAVIQALATSTTSATIYSGVVKGQAISSDALLGTCRKTSVTPIALSSGAGAPIQFVPFPETIEPGSTLFYVAEARLTEKEWDAIQKGSG